MQQWFSSTVSVTRDPHARTATTTTAFTNTMPRGDLVGYVMGLRSPRLGLPNTTMLLTVLYFAPPGTEEGRAVQSVMVAVPKGESRTVSCTSTLTDTAP